MRHNFYQIIRTEMLWTPKDKLLIAVSGGLDSMVLLHLCYSLYNDIGVAHCNFNLRGKDSDADEQLVKYTTDSLNIPFWSIGFDTTAVAKKQRKSIEMVARDLRYEYFNELCEREGYTKILTAHHANDNAETVLLNLIKGTGIRGLVGIPKKREKIVRPLLSFTQAELQQYAQDNGITYRNDYTNKTTVFKRNKLRNIIFPLLKAINPSVVPTLNNTTYRLQDVKDIYEEYIKDRLETIVLNKSIELEVLFKEKYIKTLLYEWLNPYGFSATVVDDLYKGLEDNEEKYFLSTNYHLIKSRGILSIVSSKCEDKAKYYVSDKGIHEPINLEIANVLNILDISKNIAYFDKDLLQFPLILRPFQKGDRFYPFGFKGSKKISSFFKDLKMSFLQKRKTWLLCSGDDIIWVVGLRSDERFKVTHKTKSIIKIEYKNA